MQILLFVGHLLSMDKGKMWNKFLTTAGDATAGFAPFPAGGPLPLTARLSAILITKRDKPRRFLFFPHPRICVYFHGCVNHNLLIALTSHSLALLLA